MNQRTVDFKKQLYGSHYWHNNRHNNGEQKHTKNSSSSDLKISKKIESDNLKMAGRPLISSLIAELEREDIR